LKIFERGLDDAAAAELLAWMGLSGKELAVPVADGRLQQAGERIGGHLRRQALDGDSAVEEQVSRLVDRAHAAGAAQRSKPVAAGEFHRESYGCERKILHNGS
jgi:hypothetical protein